MAISTYPRHLLRTTKKTEVFIILEEKKQIPRNHVSLGITFMFLGMAVSGIALFFAPTCRTAEQTGWSFLFISKESWESAHVTFSLLFIILSVLHIIVNWKLLASYLAIKIKNLSTLNTPMLVWTGIFIVLFVMAVAYLPPVSWIHRSHEFIKHSYSKGQAAPGQGRGRGYGGGRGQQFRLME